jgi:uncharacterized protein (TIGR02391 family)
MPINKQVRSETEAKLGVKKDAYYSRVKRVQKRYGTITFLDAAYVLAAEQEIDLTRYLDQSTCDRILEIRSKPPVGGPPSAVPGGRRLPEVTDRTRAQQKLASRECRKRPRDVIDCLNLHAKVAEASRRLFLNGHCTEAVGKALNLFTNSVKRKAGRPKNGGKELDGFNLMGAVFTPDNPILKLTDSITTSEKDEQRGYMLMAQGAITGVRNPRAHEDELRDDPQGALELLVLASHLMKKLDGAKRTRRKRST